MKPTNFPTGSETVLTAVGKHGTIESHQAYDRAIVAMQDALAKLDAADSSVGEFQLFATAKAEVALQAAISELHAERPDFDRAYKSASVALTCIAALRNMSRDGDVILGTGLALAPSEGRIVKVM